MNNTATTKQQRYTKNSLKIDLAPMEGVVDWVIRDLYSQIGGYDQMVTEFVRVTDKLVPDHMFYKYCPELKNDGKTFSGTPVYVQLLGSDPQMLAENAVRAIQLGSPGIDLNFGCPAKTVNRHDGGATLLKNPERLFNIISKVKSYLPNETVTAKVRLGFEDKTLCKDIAQAVDSAGADKLTIHARTKLEGYKPPAHWEFIAQMKEVVQQVPVVANGDIWSVEDYIRCKEVTGCNHFALGRPAIACPDLAKQIKTFEQTGNIEPKSLTWPTIREKHIPRFVNSCNEFAGDAYALRRTKQWTKLLGREYPAAADFFNDIKVFKDFENLESYLALPRHHL